MNERKKYVLQVQRGEELSLHRCEEICNEESIMRPSYEKAMRALMRIMRRTKQFHEKDGSKTADLDAFTLENQLFGYSGNIIAFAAPRGGGKTATMLSFAKILAKGFRTDTIAPVVDNSFLNDMKCGQEEQPDAWMARCCFLPLTPVAPAVLEGKQNILNVVWSRLYRYAERLLSEHRSERIKEAQKNEIRHSLQKVLSGIKGIKDPEKKFSGDLASMQDVCDGLSLSRHFHMLVQNILKLAVGDHNVSDRYLVIQLDDADSKMQRVYEVLEDVRKYLMIPNLVILMSVDQNCMSDVVLQDNLRCFPDLIRIDENRLSQDLLKISNKYIDKLIPPTHMVQLPQLHQIVIQWGDMLRLRYYVDKNELGVYEWMNHEGLDLQSAILMLIYRKTHLLFVKPPHYLHNMIPRTLRGFNQLLELLDSMEDVPGLTSEMFDSVPVYAKAILKQSEIAAINQRRFSDYFKNSWISAKITDLKDREFLRKLADTVSANRIRLTVEYLCKRYNKETYSGIRKREHLDGLMWEIEQVCRTENDFRLMFAIRTLFTMDSHQHILKRKREAVCDYLDKVKANSKEVKDVEFLLFDLSPDEMQIPNILWLDDAAEIIMKNHPTHAEDAAQYRNLLTPLLILGNPNSEAAAYWTTRWLPIRNKRYHRKFLHQAQEFVVMLYGNSDVSCTVMNYLKDNVEPNYVVVHSIEEKLVQAIIKQVDGFNDGYLKAYIVNGGVTIDQETGYIWNRNISSTIINVYNVEQGKQEQTEQEADKKEDTATVVSDNVEDELEQQGPNPGERPQFDRGKAMHKLDDEV